MSEPDDMDYADHMIRAAKLARREGLTKEQAMNGFSVFWDSLTAIEAILAEKDHPQ